MMEYAPRGDLFQYIINSDPKLVLAPRLSGCQVLIWKLHERRFVRGTRSLSLRPPDHRWCRRPKAALLSWVSLENAMQGRADPCDERRAPHREPFIFYLLRWSIVLGKLRTGSFRQRLMWHAAVAEDLKPENLLLDEQQPHTFVHQALLEGPVQNEASAQGTSA